MKINIDTEELKNKVKTAVQEYKEATIGTKAFLQDCKDIDKNEQQKMKDKFYVEPPKQEKQQFKINKRILMKAGIGSGIVVFLILLIVVFTRTPKPTIQIGMLHFQPHNLPAPAVTEVDGSWITDDKKIALVINRWTQFLVEGKERWTAQTWYDKKEKILKLMWYKDGNNIQQDIDHCTFIPKIATQAEDTINCVLSADGSQLIFHRVVENGNQNGK